MIPLTYRSKAASRIDSICIARVLRLKQRSLSSKNTVLELLKLHEGSDATSISKQVLSDAILPI